ncbi:hypothetical protein BDV12DRAFT_196531 [Aspergillus spectabilis]
MAGSFSEIPAVNLSRLQDPMTKSDELQKLREAIFIAGFLYLTDSGREYPDLPGSRELVEEYFASTSAVARQFVSYAAECLGLSPAIFDEFKGNMNRLKFVKYPPAVPGSQGDEVGGLQALDKEGQWIDAPYMDGCLVVIQQGFKAITRGICTATTHHVLAPIDKTRYSIPFFLGVRLDLTIARVQGAAKHITERIPSIDNSRKLAVDIRASSSHPFTLFAGEAICKIESSAIRSSDSCCLNRECITELGGGYCKNRDNQTCAGEWVTGSPSDYPCPGPGYIVCCVEYRDMVNSTASSTSTQTSLTTSSSTTVVTPTQAGAAPDSDSGSGLSASAKGGIAGGIVGAVLVTSIIFLIFFFLRRRKRQQAIQGGKGTQEGGDEGTDTKAGTMTTRQTRERDRLGGKEEEDKGVAMLASREKLELDASGRALHEMDSPTATSAPVTGAIKKGIEKVRTRRLAELPGSLAVVAEMPVPGEGEGEHGPKRS